MRHTLWFKCCKNPYSFLLCNCFQPWTTFHSIVFCHFTQTQRGKCVKVWWPTEISCQEFIRSCIRSALLLVIYPHKSKMFTFSYFTDIYMFSLNTTADFALNQSPVTRQCWSEITAVSPSVVSFFKVFGFLLNSSNQVLLGRSLLFVGIILLLGLIEYICACKGLDLALLRILIHFLRTIASSSRTQQLYTDREGLRA